MPLNLPQSNAAQVALITGSNGMIGPATCRKLGQARFLAASIDIGAESKRNWPYYQCELTDLDGPDRRWRTTTGAVGG